MAISIEAQRYTSCSYIPSAGREDQTAHGDWRHGRPRCELHCIRSRRIIELREFQSHDAPCLEIGSFVHESALHFYDKAVLRPGGPDL
jgi:hypothetical protein